jgi:hypothetical protein
MRPARYEKVGMSGNMLVSVKLEWIVVEKKVYNVDTQKTEYIRFLRLNVIHKYNHTMGHVDVADQLRGSYRIDIYVRNRKWWWAMMFWAFGTLLTGFRLWRRYWRQFLGYIFFGAYLPQKWDVLPPF